MKKLYIIIFINILFITKIFAQTTGVFTGRTLDKFSRRPIPDAIVEIINLGLKTGTDENGYFYFDKVEPGVYNVRFSAFGFNTIVVNDIVINSGRPMEYIAELQIIQTEEITVEAESFIKPQDINISYKKFDNEEIRRFPGGFEDVGRVVQSLPGVSFINDGRNDLIVRGGSPSENLFLIDNAAAQNINHFGTQGATGGPISIINLDFIKEVNFITGGFSARYGDRLSSVIELKLREGNRSGFSGNINLSATGFGGVFEGPIGSKKQGSFLFSIRRSYLDLVFNSAGFGFVPEYNSYQFKGVYDFNQNISLTVNSFGNFDKVRFNNDTEEKRKDNERILKNNQWGYFNSFELRTIFSSRSYALFTLTRNHKDFDFSGRNQDFQEVFKNNSKESETEIKSEIFYIFKNNAQISLGAGIKFISFENQVFSLPDTLLFIDPNPVIIPGVDFKQDNSSIKSFGYLNITNKFFNRLTLNTGLRLDYFEFINKKFYLSPRVSASYLLMKNLFINGSYGIFYQSPAYIWLVSNSQNRNLTNIKAEHYIFGFDYFPKEDIKVTLEIYYKRYSDYPVSTIRPYFILLNSGSDFETRNNFGLEPLVSAGIGFSRGIELFLQKKLTERFYGNISLSLFEVKYKSFDGIERNSDYDNRYLIILNGGYLLGKGWEVSSKFRYIGGRPYTPINPTNGTQDVNLYNSERLPDYYSLDIRVDKRWNFSKWTLVTYIDIQNITGRKNITSYRWDRYENIIETNRSIGILPSIGINAMF